MFRIKHKDDPKRIRCAFDICNRIIREFGYVCEGSMYCSEECATCDVVERTPREPCLQ